MNGSVYEYLVAGDRAVRAAWTAVGDRYGVVSGVRRREARLWLDTFDGRLRAAGLRLAYVTGAGRGGQLVLTGPDGAPASQPETGRWPRLLDALADGPVRERLRGPVGIRALLPVGKVTGTVQEVRILNADEKTVAGVRLDRAAPDGGKALPVRLSLVPVRGYQSQAERVAKILTGLAGVTADPPAEVDLVAPPGSRRAIAIPVVRPDQDAVTGLAVLLLGLLDAIEANVPGTLADTDTEFLHDLRVAVRRTRSALKLAGDALPGDLAARFGPEFKWLGDLTTPLRDLDTFLLGFDALAAELSEAAPEDLEPLRAYLLRQRAIERRRLARGLRSARFAALTSAWRAELSGLAGSGSAPTGRLAATRAGQAWRRVSRRGATTTADSPAETLHDLRKRCKELRYVLELFAGVWEPQVYREFVKELKVLQDCLGEFQDAEVHRDKVRQYAAEMLAAGLADAPALLAMGELVARLGGRQRQAGAESVARVGRFVTDVNRRRVAGLVRSA